MTNLSKVAILLSKDSDLTFELDEIQAAFGRVDIETKLFYENESILQYKPDCVIITSPQEGRLTPYPTYGLINKTRGEYLGTPRFVRNILTYDGYFTFSPILKQTLGDLMFGARKLGTSILKLDFFPAATECQSHKANLETPRIVIFDPDFNSSRFKRAIFHLLDKIQNVFVVSFSVPETDKYSERFIFAKNAKDLTSIVRQYDIAVCLNAGTKQSKTINPAVIKLISAGVVVFTHHTEELESYFSDNLYYIPQESSVSALHKAIDFHLKQIKKDPEAALKKCQNAHSIFMESFAFDNLIPKFLEFHEKTLINKGYVPHPDPKVEKALPSVSYIMRTGGKHRHFLERTLDCMVAQQYPDLRIIFVIHAHFPYMQEIIEKYSSLKIKVVESIKSRRSEAIRDGMAAVETELFGLYDDDDELFPNHVRMLVKTLQYHANRDWRGEIGMVYSGSIHADDTYAVHEMADFQDDKLTGKNEKRAIEWFRFYSSDMMSQHTWFMPNGWLARSKFIDNELLVDPELDTCEDLYFELQIAQRAHFAFSVEVTTIHHFHHFGNSTVVDSYKHLPDTQRIALRNFSRVFPQDSQYDIAAPFRLVGETHADEVNLINYQDYNLNKITNNSLNPFYPLRNKYLVVGSLAQGGQFKDTGSNLFGLPIKIFIYMIKFIKLDSSRKYFYISKFKMHVKKHGYLATFDKMKSFSSSGRGLHFVPVVHKVSILNRLMGICRYFNQLGFMKLPTKK